MGWLLGTGMTTGFYLVRGRTQLSSHLTSCHPIFSFTWSKVWEFISNRSSWKWFMSNPTSHKNYILHKHLRTRHSCWNQRSTQLIFVRKSGQRSINVNMTAVILTFIYFIPSKVFYGMTTGRDIQISWIFYWRSYIQITYKPQVKPKMGWQLGSPS